MSLGLLVDVEGGRSGESRVIAAVGCLMTATLLLAALEQFHEGGAGGIGSLWWLPLGCALACACGCIASWRRSCRRPSLRLQALQDGRWRLSRRDGRPSDAVFVRGWSMGGLIWLHLRLASKVESTAVPPDGRESGLIAKYVDCRLLLTRRSFDEGGWHALRRWLVWHRRSRRHKAVED